MNREAQTASAVWEMVEAGGRTAQSFGLSRIFGQLYMLLYMSPEPRSLDDLAAELGVSKASISIAARKLEAWGAVRKVWVKGDRRDFYKAETDFRAILNGGLLASLNKKLESARIQIERSLAMVEKWSGDEATRRFLCDRLKQAEQRRKRIAKLIDNPLVRELL
jgi:DNA-binding transcriptional regulator GbsR (MarR family)